MITLTPITAPGNLQEYYRFRYRIYSESRQKGFLGDQSGIDTDAFDDRAMHYGWYVDGTLAGCVRFVEPDGSDKPLPMFAYLTDASVIDAVSVYMTMRKAHGQRMVEASRFCLAPEHRGLRTAKEFVVAMTRALYDQRIEKALFDCLLKHAPFYGTLGFKILGGAENFLVPGLSWSGCTMSYDHSDIRSRTIDAAASHAPEHRKAA